MISYRGLSLINEETEVIKLIHNLCLKLYFKENVNVKEYKF